MKLSTLPSIDDDLIEFSRSLSQTDTWVSATGDIPRSEMTVSHRYHALGWLEANARALVAAMYTDIERLLLTFPPLSKSEDGLNAIRSDLTNVAHRMLSALISSHGDPDARLEACAVYVRETPMYQALLADVMTHKEDE